MTQDAAAKAAGGVVSQAPAQEAAAKRRALPFSGPLPELRPGCSRIVERVFDLPDPEAEFDRLWMALEVEPFTPGAVEAALNVAEQNAMKAHQLYVVFRADFERLEAETAAIVGALREAATAALQAEKDAGQRSKAITDADVTGCVAQMFPDEWSAIQERAIKARKTKEHVERLADLWKYRSSSLSALLGKR